MDSQYSEQNFEEGIVFPRGDRQSWGGGGGGAGAAGGVIFQAEKPRDILKSKSSLAFLYHKL